MLGDMVALLVLVLLPLPVAGQSAPVPAEEAQAGSDTLPPGAVRTIQDAINALNAREKNDKSVPARPLGSSPGSFFGADAYPPEAIRAHEEGRTVVRVEIDARGFPTACTVLSSSNSAILNAATCRIAHTRMQYAAARDGKGRPIASQYTLPVRWALPRDDAETTFDLTDGRKAVIDVTLDVRLDGDGNVTSCKVVEQVPEAADMCASYPVGRPTLFHAIRNGEASPARLTVINRMYLDQP